MATKIVYPFLRLQVPHSVCVCVLTIELLTINTIFKVICCNKIFVNQKHHRVHFILFHLIITTRQGGRYYLHFTYNTISIQCIAQSKTLLRMKKGIRNANWTILAKPGCWDSPKRETNSEKFLNFSSSHTGTRGNWK